MESGRPILVPVDFSPHSEAALAWAAELADRLDIPLTVLHVVHDPVSDPGYYSRADSSGLARPMADVARDLLDGFLARAQAAHPRSTALASPQVELIEGLPATRILEVAEQVGAQLIVMGSLGRTGLRNLLLGSKAQRVVKLATIPVTIVKMPKESGG